MSKFNNYRPAFPRSPGDHEGMTLRDWFAGQALPGYIAHLGAQGFHSAGYADECAIESYVFADAMLRARENGK